VSIEPTAEARRTYDAFAASYDDFNHRYRYERWTGKLLERARAAGLEGDRLLDVGCGTGLSFLALLADGWDVVGCDVSPRMLDAARGRIDRPVALHVADMRSLPLLGEFDLVWAVNDAINYLGDAAELEATLAGMKRNLAAGGVVLFDVNTLTAYRTFFAEEVVVERDGKRFVWSGMGSPGDGEAGSIFEARFDGDGAGIEPHTHRQRHFSEPEVRAAIEAAGLACVEVAGELDGELTPGVDEDTHTKAVYVCSGADRGAP
jgi:SAM-dependent methyltransferase